MAYRGTEKEKAARRDDYRRLMADSPERYRANRRRSAKKGRARLDALKSYPCSDCGKVYPPYVMDFDHCRGPKTKAVSFMATYSLERLLAEIEKCDLVCSNCHRERTHRRGY